MTAHQPIPALQTDYKNAAPSTHPKPVVAIFADPLLPPSMTFVRAQATALTRYSPLYVSPQRASPGLEIPREQAVVLCDDPQAPRIWRQLKQVPLKVFGHDPLFFRRVEKHKPVLLHAHFGPAGLTALPLARWLNVPVVVTIHGYDASVTDADLARANYRARAYVRNRHVLHRETALYIAVSEFLRKQMIARGFPEQRIVVHYIGIDTQHFRPDPSIAREPVVLFTGRLTEKKGCAHLIRAMQKVVDRVPAARLVVIGDGELRQDLERTASSSLRNYRFLGMQPPTVVREWMNRASVFCVPSVRATSGDAEGFGLVFAEAQAMGLPVASFSSGGVPEAVQHAETGLLAMEGDWLSLADHILTLLQDRNCWQTMSEAGRKRIQRCFDLTTQTAKLEEMYQSLLKDSSQQEKVATRPSSANAPRKSFSLASSPKRPAEVRARKLAFVQTLCTHYTVGLFTLLAQRLDAQFFFYSDGGEWYWQAEHGISSGDFPHEYLSGFRVGRTRIAPTLPWKLLLCPTRAILSCIDGKYSLPVAYLAARMKRVPFLLWTGLWCRVDTPLQRWIFPLTRFVYRNADGIVVYGEHVKRYLVSEGVRPERIFVAPHAVDNSLYSRPVSGREKEAVRRNLSISREQKVILYLGRLERAKGVSYLVEAFAASYLREAVLVIAGTGSARGALEHLVSQLGCQERVRFAGYVPVGEAVCYYALADVAVLPSVTTPKGKEPWGLVVNEAFNQSVPVITTDAVGAVAGGLLRDGENGLVVPEANAAALAQALEAIGSNSGTRDRMATEAKRSIAAWNHDAQSAGFAQALQFVLESRASL